MFILSAIALLIIVGLLICFLVISLVNKELLSENEVLKIENNKLKWGISYNKNLSRELTKEVRQLKYDLKFEKTLSKTFSDGLDALTNKK